MNINELAKKLFDEPMNYYLDGELYWIHEELKKHPDTLRIDIRDYDIDDIIKKTKNRDYLTDEYLVYLEDGIRILTPTKEFFLMIKDQIPRTLTELTIPGDMLDNLDFLTEFPNLEKLNFSDNTQLTAEQIIFLREKTSIREITTKSYNGYDSDVLGKEGFVSINYPIKVCNYDGLMVSSNYNKGKKHQNARLTATVNSYYKDLEKLQDTYEYISPFIESIAHITLKEGSPVNDNSPVEVDINQTEDNISAEVTIPTNDPKKLIVIFNAIDKKVPVKKVTMECSNQTHEDMHYLKAIDRKCALEIDYGSSLKTTYEEYQNMRGAIDWYKEVISQENLSPLEIITYAYDIMKTFKYLEDEDDKERSRYIPAIVTDGKIVCVGYSTFFQQLLQEFGIKTEKLSVSTPDQNNQMAGHARNIVRVDDDKYNIHGIYVFDATWDSVKQGLSKVETEEGKQAITQAPQDKDEILDTYDALTLYRHFLVPLSEYETRYPKDTLPPIYKSYKDDTIDDTLNYIKESKKTYLSKPESVDYSTKSSLENLFEEDEGTLTIEKYIEASRPSLETFKQVITTVRKAQGYTPEQATSQVEKDVELHQMLQEQNGSSELFFEPTKTK